MKVPKDSLIFHSSVMYDSINFGQRQGSKKTHTCSPGVPAHLVEC